MTGEEGVWIVLSIVAGWCLCALLTGCYIHMGMGVPG